MNEKINIVHSPKIQFDDMPYETMQKLLEQPEVQGALKKANEGYLHWEELKYKNWIPNNFFPSKELFWTFLTINRYLGSSPTPIRDEKGNIFKMKTESYSEILHIIDKEMAGNFMGVADLSENDRKQFIARNIIEESIASSQLEGANTSRAVAKKMLLEGRQPHNHSEQMIVNNHKAMSMIEEKLNREKLSWNMICELHSIITDKTLHESKQGKLRETLDENGNRLVIKPWDDETVAYITPDKEFVEAELPKLIDFANDVKNESDNYIHPLLKAIMIHFWIGLLHPFEDGNGRLARILFYWYMLKNEYWAFAFLSMSEKIKKSSKQYAKAFIYSEQEGCDLTYFIDYNIRKLKLARKEFQDYLKNKISENRSIITFVQRKYDFNERQIKLLQYFNRKMEERTNVVYHQKFYSVKKGAAILDLKELVKKKFLIKKRFGKNIFYYPTAKVAKLFK
jgi:Fic family protein